eukprot:CAMPEP_0198570206 /NCGR_PEP_ID=MMETSP1462-20131121/108800_1 /TAXON_ID=1333877 /ORGANISM="Brandtodinium nutriculum, Strain RCC3387" /LENGTH=32 /DNA_ID= /DNA_START= /DNA_END= /DNA_ORIENTATION=
MTWSRLHVAHWSGDCPSGFTTTTIVGSKLIKA